MLRFAQHDAALRAKYGPFTAMKKVGLSHVGNIDHVHRQTHAHSSRFPTCDIELDLNIFSLSTLTLTAPTEINEESRWPHDANL